MAQSALYTELPAIDKNQAIAIATAEFHRNGGLGEVDVYASENRAGWSVTVSERPAAPGGFISYQISRDGKIMNIVPGE